ncbi:hypothetical protein [Noviherbaspirillum autotrophicum]|uniref:hypothetical protein n=1 Tax=Noviherbaspirillum autotrophicum TaxID=709839 RepID=UPI000693F81D|nr:hypothetical protein [Noviherbaspirillum autotrophicum]
MLELVPDVSELPDVLLVPGLVLVLLSGVVPVPDVPLEPLLMLPEPEVLVSGVELAPELPLLLSVPEDPDDPDEEESLFGGLTVVVVVVTVPDEPEAPEVPEAPDELEVPDDASVPDGAALFLAASSLVVVVVVVWPNDWDAIPISDKKIAIGNFFMLAPSEK